ncbi:CDGSH iron-sulfur domain-containing protein [Acetobacterium woodii]|uniref:Zinc finger CDGSH-type domain protein n=1 Tax=Acetobacterium woodii (strain ATCC 29683 / DSM 1030 / JCM 2381 / KCTC 1655 / WB1) TaxID=931626 RepID=H6LJ14_ACEWD|nr:CDGSH iron-sulfur domain-containing protein [Acetobacterium woodii]AFA47377.1 zinc finger CDGSH-type domain protein [Acetobacterium woodii DSM 1030]
MEKEMQKKIKILKDGPYLVTGQVKLSEKIITSKGKGYVYTEGRTFPQSKTYTLCRCGKSKNPPFCDGAHSKCDFKGEETASKVNFDERAELFIGPDLDMKDDHRCAFARFCHRNDGTAWELIGQSDDPKLKEEAIKAASECPAGRLVAVEKNGNDIEPEYEPEIVILQDPERGVSCGIFVKGGIPLQSADGSLYETRNRVVLCRCGESNNKPFCDATHVNIKYLDEKQ